MKLYNALTVFALSLSFSLTAFANEPFDCSQPQESYEGKDYCVLPLLRQYSEGEINEIIAFGINSHTDEDVAEQLKLYRLNRMNLNSYLQEYNKYFAPSLQSYFDDFVTSSNEAANARCSLITSKTSGHRMLSLYLYCLNEETERRVKDIKELIADYG